MIHRWLRFPQMFLWFPLCCQWAVRNPKQPKQPRQPRQPKELKEPNLHMARGALSLPEGAKIFRFLAVFGGEINVRVCHDPIF